MGVYAAADRSSGTPPIMRPMRTTILAPALVLALAAFVAGCGGSSSGGDKANTIQSTPTQTTPTATTTTTTPTTTAPPAGGDTTETAPATPPAPNPATGGTPSGGNSSGSGSGGVYPGQAPANPMIGLATDESPYPAATRGLRRKRSASRPDTAFMAAAVPSATPSMSPTAAGGAVW